RRDRVRRCTDESAVSGRCRAAVRPSAALPRRQGGRRGGHHRRRTADPRPRGRLRPKRLRGDLMARYAVLLRGINVGGNKKIAMADLRRLLEKLGFSEVSTLLQSGNAIVTSQLSAAKAASVCEKGIEDAFGMSVRCLVLTGAQLRAVIDAHPMAGVAD